MVASLSTIVGCSARAPVPEVVRLVDRVEDDRVFRHIEALAALGPRTSTSIEATRGAVEYIERQLRSFGYDVQRERVRVKVTGDTGEVYEHVNVVATLGGDGSASPILELGAHYDSVEDSPGADDNASGVAGVLECARVLAGLETEGRVLRFVLFGLEEYGKGGSFFHVAAALDRKEAIEGTFIFEMIGFTSDEPGSQDTPIRIPLLIWPPTVGDFVTVAGNLRSGALGNRFESSIERYVPELEYYSVNRLAGVFSDASRSDHEAYWTAGIPAIMLTDTANFRNPNYHRPTDTPDTIDRVFAGRVVRAMVATLAEWAIAPRD